MSTNDHARLLREYLETLANAESLGRVPSYRDWMSRAAGVAAVGVALSLSACGGASETSRADDGGTGQDVGSGGAAGQSADSSHGGTWDESQGGALAASGGMMVDYGIMMVENCGDRVDNDEDRLVDCADPDCDEDPACTGHGGMAGGGRTGAGGALATGGAMVVPYGIMMEYACADGLDNDGDLRVDCADSDCGDDANCMGSGGVASGGRTGAGGSTASGGAGGAGGNGGTASGGRTGAGGDLAMGGALVPPYGIMMEYNCADGLDNDGDGLLDCADDDCVNNADCMGSGGAAGSGGMGTGGGGEKYGVVYSGGTAGDGGVPNDGGSGGDIALGGAMVTEYGIVMREICDDGEDNDGDQAADCYDMDCLDDPACPPDSGQGGGWGALYGVPLPPESGDD